MIGTWTNDWRARCQDQAGYYKYSEGVKALSPFIWKASESNGGWSWHNCHVEKSATIVTSPEFGDSDDNLLGVVQAASFKGSNQADVILNLLENYDIVDHIFAVCCDTISSNTGVFSWAIVLLPQSRTLPPCSFSEGDTCWKCIFLTS